MLNKQLLLDVAQLTDVGRRREHNEDNMAYVIPKDPQVMERKGALFIVADGMGGHAAGEVASEIAVDTISTTYYPDEHEDIADALLNAIKRTNTLIHQRAAENMLRSGMGTTTVVGVLRGNMAYVANVGDSRAYMIRKGKIKQISQDHSWVAEQVRAGLLTEEQARTHAQRNVITRSLGTQPEVDVDVFAEPLEEGDILLLCSDGLSGVVSDDEIRSIVERFAPQESVYHLIERANENGGPDNITAIVITVQEVGVEPPGARHPVVAGRINGSNAGEDTAILSLPSYLPNSPSSAFGDASAPHFGRFSSGPLPPAETSQADRASRRKPRGRLLYVAVAACFLLLLVALIGGGTYVYLTQNTGGSSVSHEIDGAQKLIDKAQGETPNNPAAALRDLSQAQTQLTTLAKSSALNSQQHTKVLSLLQGSFTQSVQNAIVTYNQQQGMISVDCLNPSSSAVGVGTTNTQPKALALTQVNGKSALYALGTDNQPYIVNTPNNSLIHVTVSALAKTTIENMVGYNGSQLALLVSQPGKASSIPNYSLDILSVPQNKLVSSIPLSLRNGQAPSLLAAWGQDIYVVLIAPNSTSISIEDFAPAKGGNHQLQMTSTSVSVSSAPGSIAAFPNKQLFLLLQDGTVQSLQLSSSQSATTSVFVDQQVPQPLAASAPTFNWQTPVPTAPTTGSKALAIPNAPANALVSALVGNVPHLYIMDSNLHRILDLTVAPASDGSATSTPTATASAGTVGGGTNAVPGVGSVLHLQQQYESAGLFAQMRSLVVDAQDAKADVLAESTTSSLNLVSFPLGGKPQASCT